MIGRCCEEYMKNLNMRQKRACIGHGASSWCNGDGGSGTVPPPLTAPPKSTSRGTLSYSAGVKTESTNTVTYSWPRASTTSYGSLLLLGSSSVRPRIKSQPSRVRVTEEAPQEHSSSYLMPSELLEHTIEINDTTSRNGEERREYVRTDQEEEGNTYFDKPTSFVVASLIVLLAGTAIGIFIRAGIAAASEYRQRGNER